MPNHVKNRLIIDDEETQIKEIMERIKFDEHGVGSIDFEKIIPMPPELKVESGSRSKQALELYSLYIEQRYGESPGFFGAFMRKHQVDRQFMDFGKQLYENKQKYGAADWYDWSISNWGTKWNSYGYAEGFQYDGSNEIIFETAWSRPEPIVKALSKMFPDIEFRHQWADEDIGCNVGEILYHGGEEIEWDIPTAFSKEAYEMASDILGTPLTEWGLYYDKKTGSYECREDEPVEASPPKPSLRDTLRQNAEQSKAELGDSVPALTKDKGEPSL